MPSAPLLYLLKAHAVLLLFAAAYFGLLRPLTFFALNRAYLAFALLFAAAYPALPVPALWPAAASAPAGAWVLAELPAGAPAAALPAPGPDWPAWLLAAYAAGAALLLGRLLVQLLSLARLHRAARPALAPGGVAYRQLADGGGPFSFGRTIYLSPAQHPAPAELAAVLAHEQAHVRQAHTLDVLLAHVATAVFWLNPAVWLLRRALLDNLEYLADAATLRTGLDRRAYQYSLLRLGSPAGSPALVSPFSLSTLKNRILMMNRPVSTRLQLLRYALAGPLVVAAALAYSAAQAEPAAAPAALVDESFGVSHPAAISPAFASSAAADKEIYAAATPQVSKTELPVAAPNEQARRGALAKPGARNKVLAVPGPGQVTEIDGVPTSQKGPKPGLKPFKGAARSYYVDGQYVDEVAATAINPNDLANIQVLEGGMAKQFLEYDGDSRHVIVITTKAKMDAPEVVEFNKKVQQVAPLKGMVQAAPTKTIAPADSTEKAVSPMYLGSAGLAYITKHYPDARLVGVDRIRSASGGAPRYRAAIVIGRRPGYITFDERGQFISESYNK